MTSLSINTSATTANAVLSLPIMASFDNEMNTAKSLFTYTVTTKNSYRKSAPKFHTIDWDLNKSELEFE